MSEETKKLLPEQSQELLKTLNARFEKNMNRHKGLEWAKVQEVREKHGVHPGGNVIDMAAAMGIELLTEEQYRGLQKLGNFDTKSSSWVKTPSDIRKVGGAIFADRRYGNVFIYHNSAPTFYGVRAFRGSLRV